MNAPHRSAYAPYHMLDAFQQGVSDYSLGRFRNPWDGDRRPGAGVNAQAWDRGMEYAMRVERDG